MGRVFCPDGFRFRGLHRSCHPGWRRREILLARILLGLECHQGSKRDVTRMLTGPNQRKLGKFAGLGMSAAASGQHFDMGGLSWI